MKRMWDEQEFVELIKKYAPQVKPKDIQEMFNEGEVSLAGKYVRIMDAPESTTLTDEQIEQIKEGVFIKGNFLGFHNPILFPTFIGTFNLGCIIGTSTAGYPTTMAIYSIDSSKVIRVENTPKIALNNASASVELIGNVTLRGKAYPSNPSNTGTFTLKMVNGTLTWVEDI